MSTTNILNENKSIRFLRTEEAKICNFCPYPNCKSGVCDYYKDKMKELRNKYGKKRI